MVDTDQADAFFVARPMPLIQSKIEVTGEAFLRNRAGMLKLILTI